MTNDKQRENDICAVYCPNCKQVTNGVSLKLLMSVKCVYVTCQRCGGITILEYDGDSVSISQG
ncbi:MAG: hypothetical protein LBP19_01110 [Treponema sp.]|jgi:RNase P subunit RPR2|nr:hypothetical protein [Treponema sp.]